MKKAIVASVYWGIMAVVVLVVSVARGVLIGSIAAWGMSALGIYGSVVMEIIEEAVWQRKGEKERRH